MSEKELMYVEDSLSHLEQLHTFCDNTILDIEDDDISNAIEKIMDDNKKVFNDFFALLEN